MGTHQSTNNLSDINKVIQLANQSLNFSLTVLNTTISTTQLLFTKTRHKCQIHATIKGLTFYLMPGEVEVIVALARIHKTIIKKNLKGELSWCFLCENVFWNRYMRF